MYQQYGLKIDRGYNLYALGMLALHQNNYPLAKQFFIDYDCTNREFGEQRVTGEFLTILAAVASEMNEPEHAATLSGAAAGISDGIENGIAPMDRAEFDRRI